MNYQNYVLVRLFVAESDNKDAKLIKAYHTSSFSETLKMYNYMEEEEIPIRVPNDNNFGTDYNEDILFIHEIEVGFGSSESLVCIDIFAGDTP